MRIVFIGNVVFSKHMLEKLIDLNLNVVGVCTTKSSNFNSDFYDAGIIAKKHNIKVLYFKNINSENSISWIKQQAPDIIFCLGLSKILKSNILNIPPRGVVGFHPALIPSNRGRHPIIWALSLGLKKTGSTFFFMDEGADSGDIISQEEILISNIDNANSLYEKIIKTAKKQLEIFIPAIQKNNLTLIKQNNNLANYWRKRTVIDGLIDWRMTKESIYNLVRALSKPYVGAHFIYEGQSIILWECKMTKLELENIEPGKVIDIKDNCPIVNVCNGGIILQNIEPRIKINLGDYL